MIDFIKKNPYYNNPPMYTYSDTNEAIPTLDDIRTAISELDSIMKDNGMCEPAIVAQTIATVFPYVLNAVVAYDNEEEEDA